MGRGARRGERLYILAPLVLHWRFLENKMETLSGVQAFFELFLQGGFGLDEDPALPRFPARKIGEGRELILQIGRGDSIPEAIFEREHFRLVLFHPEDRCVRQPDRDFIRAQVHGDVLLQIEAGFSGERTMELHPLRAPSPSVEQFMFDFDLARENRELGGGRRFLEINTVVDRDAGLQMRYFHKRIAQVASDALEFRRALFCRARGPALQPQKNNREQGGADQNDQR